MNVIFKPYCTFATKGDSIRCVRRDLQGNKSYERTANKGVELVKKMSATAQVG